LRHPLARLVLWLALLLAVSLAGQNVIVAHRTRMRGLPDGFPAPVADADVPILGVNVALEQYEDADLDAALASVAEGGFVWVRQSFYWSQVEPVPGVFDWRGSDRFMAALARHPQLRLVAVLDDDPSVPPVDPDRFAAFAGGFATRYGAQVDHYQIWDEPNLADHWGGGPVNPAAYADLLARAARAIRAADPNAYILLAGLAPTTETGPQNLSDVRYLERLYQTGAAPYFDIVAGKPYGFDSSPDDRRVDEAILNFSRLLLLRDAMVEHGDAGKPVWASHWGWNALPPGWTGLPSIWGQTDEPTQAARTIAALERARSEWPWVGALILEHFQPAASADDPRWGFALVGQDGAPGLVYQAVRAWAAALPNGAPVGGYLARGRWATYEGDWLVGPLGADVGGPAALTTGSDGSRAAFRFEGTSVALTVRRGPYRAFLYVTVDGVPANALPQDGMGRAYVVLYDSVPSVATVPLATNLSAGIHTVEVVAVGGQGQWSLVDWRVGPVPVQDGYRWKLGVLAAAVLALAALLVRDARRVAWGNLARQFLAWPEWAQAASVAAVTGLLWATAGISWGRGLYSTAYASLSTTQSLFPTSSSLFPASCFLLSLLTLPLLAALLSLRPDLGLSLVALTAPFYLRPARMFYQALSLPEILVLLCGIGIICHKLRTTTSRANESTSLRILESTCPRLSPIDRSVALLILAAVVATLVAANWRAAFFELLTVFLFPALYYALLRRTRLDDQARWRIVDGLILGGVSVAVVGLMQYVLGYNVAAAEGGLPRLQSVYPSPNNAALYLERAWPVLLAVAVHPGGAPEGLTTVWKHRRRFYGLALVPVTLALALSFSRGALLLGIPAALVVMGWRAGGRYRWAALALVLVGALVLVPLLRVPRFASMLDLRQGSTFFRLELWRSSLTLIREHSLFGIGPGNFLDAYRTRYVLPSAWQEFNLEHPHNIYLDHWTRLGLLGLLAGAGVQVTFWFAVRRRENPGSRNRRSELLVLGFVGGIAGMLAHGLVDNTVFFPDLALTLFLMLGIIQSNGVLERVPNAFETI
jgi:O-antigen ligase